MSKFLKVLVLLVLILVSGSFVKKVEANKWIEVHAGWQDAPGCPTDAVNPCPDVAGQVDCTVGDTVECYTSPECILNKNYSPDKFWRTTTYQCECTPAPDSCSAATPACGHTTTGTNSCGTACSRVGDACPVTFQVKATHDVGGNATPASQDVTAGGFAQFEVTPNPGYTFNPSISSAVIITNNNPRVTCNGDNTNGYVCTTTTQPIASGTYIFSFSKTPVDCVVSWSTCTNGSQTSTVTTPASNGGAACPTSPRTCGTAGGWSAWGGWGACSASCGGGTQTRSRVCNNPPPSGGGAACSGLSTDSQVCNTQDCPPQSCDAPLAKNVTVACDVNAYGDAAISGSVTRRQIKSDYPDCAFPDAPVTLSNSTYVSDNCVYPAHMSGSLSSDVDSCAVAVGSNSCTAHLTWAVTNPEALHDSAITSELDNTGVAHSDYHVFDSASMTNPDTGTSKAVTIPGGNGGRTFYLYNNSQSLFPTSEAPNGSGLKITATCVGAWSGSTCTNSRAPTVSFDHTPPESVTSGTTVNIAWITNYNPTSCTGTSSSPSDIWNGSKLTTGGSQYTSPITASTTYTITCSNSYGTSAPATATIGISAPANPNDGVCSSPLRHYTCATGTPANGKNHTANWTWDCKGNLPDGATVSCTEKKKVPVYQEK
jgi:hypothetical protein